MLAVTLVNGLCPADKKYEGKKIATFFDLNDAFDFCAKYFRQNLKVGWQELDNCEYYDDETEEFQRAKIEPQERVLQRLTTIFTLFISIV